LSLAARIVALVVVAAAGVYAVHRRRVEFDLLRARGVAPLRLGIRSGLEALVPAAAGAALGWAVALFAVKAFGPSRVIPPGRGTDALQQVGWTAAVGVILVGLAAGLAARGETESRLGRIRGAAARVPWEAVVLALAAAAFYEILTRGGGPIGPPDEPPRVDRLLLLFPILFVAGAAGLAVRSLRRLLPRLRAARAGSPPAYLALRRLASAPRMALLLVTASALAVGMLSYAGVLSTSIRTTADVKASMSVGSDVSVILGGEASAVPGIPSTPVERVQDVTLVPAGPPAEVLGIDRRTFAGAAFWDASVIGGSVEDVVGKLAPATAERLPVAVAGDAPTSVRAIRIPGGDSLPVQVVSRLEAFPGNRPGTVTVVTDLAGLQRSAQAHGTSVRTVHELWAKGDPTAVLRRLAAHRIPTDVASTAEAAKRSPRFLALSWTFGYLEALGVAAGLVALLGMVLYLQARQRDREVAYALARRMGLTSGAHGASVALELAGMLVVAFVIGTALAVAAAWLVFARLDPLPALPPTPLLRLPFSLFLGAAGVLVLASVAGAWIVQQRADRANVAEMMRLAG
jgi:putative ABC transport system permease protein